MRTDDQSSRALHITPRQRHALQLLASGHATDDLAAGLGVTPSEAATLLKDLFSAMGTATSMQAVADAHRRGLLT